MKHNPLGYTYSYLLEDALTLIDTGTGSMEAVNGLTHELRSVGLDLDDIRRVIVTHLHGDHIGLVNYIREISGAEVVAHESAVENQQLKAERVRNASNDIKKEAKLMGASRFIGLLNGVNRRLRGRPYILEIDRPVKDGETLKLERSILQVYWTPGHAAEHICLHDKKRRLLYAGDHALPKITPHVSLYDPYSGDPLGDFINSLNKIRGLDVVKVLPAHEWVYDDLDARVNAIIAHHVERCGEMKKAMLEGASTVFEISSQVHWDSRPWPQMSFWTKRMAAAETLSHLVYMRNREDISEELRDGVLHYTVNARP
jgi:glyoxylase-like metal-dependent hydrolase (beta-lactamase superfamily II)